MDRIPFILGKKGSFPELQEMIQRVLAGRGRVKNGKNHSRRNAAGKHREGGSNDGILTDLEILREGKGGKYWQMQGPALQKGKNKRFLPTG